MLYPIGKLQINSEEYKEKLKHLPVMNVIKEIMNLSGCSLKESKKLIDKINSEIYLEKDSVVKEIYLEPIIDIPQCDTGAPLPVVFSDGNFVYLFYYFKDDDPNWDGTYVNIRKYNDTDIVCIKFRGDRQYKFGSPNDDAIEGHSLYKYGLKPYTFFEVKNSEWVKKLMKMNRVHFLHKDEYFDNCKHYIFFFMIIVLKLFAIHIRMK